MAHSYLVGAGAKWMAREAGLTNGQVAAVGLIAAGASALLTADIVGIGIHLKAHMAEEITKEGAKGVIDVAADTIQNS